MVNRNLMRQYDAPIEFEEKIDDDFLTEIGKWIERPEGDFDANKIVKGKVVEIRGEEIVVDIGYKSEGLIRLEEWREEGVETPLPKPGDEVEVLLETVEGEDGGVALSYRKAKRQKEWNAVLE
jgi:small subunit ribosomal protein S1